MPHVNEYVCEWQALDAFGNVVAEGPVTVHTTEHHSDHTSRSWCDHMHELVAHSVKSALDAAQIYNTSTIAYKNFQFCKREFQPYARKVFNIIINAMKRRRSG